MSRQPSVGAPSDILAGTRPNVGMAASRCLPHLAFGTSTRTIRTNGRKHDKTEIDQVIGHKFVNNVPYYLVHWISFSCAPTPKCRMTKHDQPNSFYVSFRPRSKIRPGTGAWISESTSGVATGQIQGSFQSGRQTPRPRE